MSTTETKYKPSAGKARKFLFDANCFDDGYVEEIVEVEPPPPSFSEAELEQVRTASYAHGKKDGLAEAEAARDKRVADLLHTISRDMKTLFSSETARYVRYEEEAVSLAIAVFRKLFPALNETHGLDEIERAIAAVLERRRDDHEIIIEIHPDYSDSIRDRLQQSRSVGKITVKSNETLGPGDCRMHWNNGGAERSATALAEEIHKKLEHMLAGRALLRDNETVDADGATNGESE